MSQFCDDDALAEIPGQYPIGTLSPKAIELHFMIPDIAIQCSKILIQHHAPLFLIESLVSL
jgi:hypothetical protein